MKPVFLVFVLIVTINGMAQPVQDNTAIVKNILNAFNKHDWQKMLQYYAAEAEFLDPSFNGPVQDKNLIAAHYQKILDHIPDVHDELKSIYAFGDTVVIEFVSTGSTVNGEPFFLPVCTVFTFKNGLVIRDATYYDIPHN